MDAFSKAKQFFVAGLELFGQEKYHEAEIHFLNALEWMPERISTLTNLSAVQIKLEKYDQARSTLNKIISLDKNNSDAWLNLGLVEYFVGNFEKAVQDFEQAVESRPDFAEAWSSRAMALAALRRYDEALIACERAISLDMELFSAWIQKAIALNGLCEQEKALTACERALQIAPQSAEAWAKKAVILGSLKRFEEALSAAKKAIAFDPDCVEAWFNQGDMLGRLQKYDLASECFAQAHRLKAPFALGLMLHQKMLGCDWSDLEAIKTEIEQGLAAGKRIAEPFGYQGIAESEKDLQRCAEIYAETAFGCPDRLNAQCRRHSKIRVGYLCGEFRNQATSLLMAGLYEAHDKDRFEIVAFDSGWDDGSDIRRRINKAFNEIVDIRRLGDVQAAQLICDKEIDILVNLNGYFGEVRHGVFARRPAPIQVNYLGFPGTLGSSCMDYLIADATVIPTPSRAYYNEKIVYLPHCYQPNDLRRQIAERQFSRADMGLPEDGFVYCCFNNNYKITPETFDSWMRILKAVETSVLWLIEDNRIASRNLKAEAARRGVAAGRLVFAERMELPLHLARHRLADLFLDTLPYNAHTTASDALWTGLPVLTLSGNTFPGRVAASLLKAVELPELITTTRHEYVTSAIDLACKPGMLREIRRKLEAGRHNAPLFDSTKFAQYIESAFAIMHERHFNGLPPEFIEVHC